MFCKLAEFFKDEKDRLSMTRLGFFVALICSSIALIMQTYMRGLSDLILGLYCATFAGLSGWNKYLEVQKGKADAVSKKSTR